MSKYHIFPNHIPNLQILFIIERMCSHPPEFRNYFQHVELLNECFKFSELKLTKNIIPIFLFEILKFGVRNVELPGYEICI